MLWNLQNCTSLLGKISDTIAPRAVTISFTIQYKNLLTSEPFFLSFVTSFLVDVLYISSWPCLQILSFKFWQKTRNGYTDKDMNYCWISCALFICALCSLKFQWKQWINKLPHLTRTRRMCTIFMLDFDDFSPKMSFVSQEICYFSWKLSHIYSVS